MTWGNEISREEAEMVLTDAFASSTAGGLVGVLDGIRREADSDQSAFIGAFARIAAAEAATSDVAPVIVLGGKRRASTLALVPIRRAAATAASAMLIVASLAGVAVAADHSGPGDILYGLDRALEAIGVGSGGGSERLEEAEGLIDNGNYRDGLSHATETLESVPRNDTARDAIEDAATRLGQTPDSASRETLDNVASLLQYLAENPHGGDPGGVASLARDIVPHIDTPAPDAPPANPPADLPGSDKGVDRRDDSPSTTRPRRP